MAIMTEPEATSASEGQHTPPRQPSASSLADAAVGSSRAAYADLVSNIKRGEQATRDASDAVAIAREAQREALETKAAVVGPQLRRAREAGESFTEAVAATPRPIAPTLPPPPSRGLRAFLAPTEGEAPEASIQKLIAGLGLFASMTGGGSRRSAIGSLAAFQGAMKGWQEGDKERADRAFADWKAQTETVLSAHDRQVADWDAWFKTGNLSVDQMLRGATISALEQNDVVAARAFSTGSLEKALEHVEKVTGAATTIRAKMAEILASRELSEAKMAQLAEHQRDALAQQAALHAAELRSREAIAAASLALRKEIEAGRREDKEAARAEGKVLPAGEVEKLAEAGQFVRQLRRAEELYKPEYAGPVENWTRWLRAKTTGLPEKETEFRSLVANFENTLLKLRSGAAVTTQEYERIKRELPQFGDPDKVFPVKLRVAREMLENILRAKGETFGSAGYKVPDLSVFSRGAAQTVTLPDGTVVEVSR